MFEMAKSFIQCGYVQEKFVRERLLLLRICTMAAQFYQESPLWVYILYFAV